MPDRIPAIRVLLLPKDTNAHGTIFGGVILSHIDLASAIEARTIAAHRYVTRAMREVEFHEPVFVGDIVCFYTELVRVGHTSVTIRVPPARMGMTGHGDVVKVTAAEVVLVAVNDQGRPIPILPDAADREATASHQPPTTDDQPPTTDHQPPTTTR